MPVSLAEQIVEVERELALRRKRFQRMVEVGRMQPRTAERALENMEAVRQTLRRLAEEGRR